MASLYKLTAGNLSLPILLLGDDKFKSHFSYGGLNIAW